MVKVATAGSKEAKQLLEVQRAFDKAYKESMSLIENTKYALEDIEGMSEKAYNHHGWVKVNDVLTSQELADFQKKVGDRTRQGNWYLDLGNGKQMFAVGQDGVNSTLIISDGKFNAPSIEKVYHIGLDCEADIEIVRDVIYEREKDSDWSLQSTLIEEVYGNEVVGSYTATDFETFSELSRRQKRTKSRGNFRSDSKLQDGEGSNSKAQPKYSVSDSNIEMSSEDGIFFDGKNAREFKKDSISSDDIVLFKNDVSGTDIMLDIPTRSDIALVQENLMDDIPIRKDIPKVGDFEDILHHKLSL